MALSPLPKLSRDPLYLLIRGDTIAEFNQKKQEFIAKNGTGPDFSDLDFRNVSLRGIDAAGINFSGAYFRQADLRGVDFREAKLDGASFSGARISGAYFPQGISAEEIRLSVEYGTRVRCCRTETLTPADDA